MESYSQMVRDKGYGIFETAETLFQISVRLCQHPDGQPHLWLQFPMSALVLCISVRAYCPEVCPVSGTISR